MSIINFLAVLALLIVFWTLMIKKGMHNLTCHRSFSRTRVFEGETGELIEVVRNDGPYIIPWLRVESYISPNIRLGRQESMHVSNETFYRSCFTLMPYQQIRRKHPVRFLGRGVYDLGNASLGAGDLLGMTRFWRDQQLSTPVIVYPQILDTDELPYPLSMVLGELVTRTRTLSDPFLVRGLRPYQPGDPVKDIHWQATARSEDVLVKLHDYTVCTRLLVVFNAQSHDAQWDDYIRPEDVPTVESTIRLAASMCLHAVRNGLSAGFATNMAREPRGKSTVLLPTDGAISEELLLESFARLQLHCSEKFLTLLQSLEQHTGLDILVISPYDSQDIRERIAALERRGNQVTFYQTEGGAQ